MRIGRRSSGGVSITLMSRTPTSAMCSVRGIGVARQRQHVHLGAQLLEPLLVRHAEALLLVNHQQAQVLEGDVLLQQAVRADDDVDRASGEVAQHLLLLLRRAEAGEQLDAHGKGLRRSLKVLKCCWARIVVGTSTATCSLVQHGLEGGAQGHLGLAVADIAADQAVHRAGALHVAL